MSFTRPPFAMHVGAAPLPASSGKTVCHRLNRRGGSGPAGGMLLTEEQEPDAANGSCSNLRQQPAQVTRGASGSAGGQSVAERNTSSGQLGLWIAIGIVVGAGFGAAAHNIAVGVGIGLVLGVAVGVAMGKRRSR